MCRSYLRYRNQIVAGVCRAKAQNQRQPHSRTEQPNFHLIFQIMRQISRQNVEIQVQRDHCKVPDVTPTVRTAASSVESQLCLPASPLWRRQSRGPDVEGRYISTNISERWRSLTSFQWTLLADRPTPPVVCTGEVHHKELEVKSRQLL